MSDLDPTVPSADSLRAAMAAAWRDHHHARDQTWRSLQIEAALGAGLVTVDAQFGIPLATLAAGALVIVAALFGFGITWHHRKLERRKFIHLMNCEELLGLHRDDVVPLDEVALGDFGVAAEEYRARQGWPRRPQLVSDAAVKVPPMPSFWDLLNPCKHNTALFIMRMHVAIAVFAVVLVSARIDSGPKTP